MSRQRRHRRVSKKRGNGEGSIAKRKDGRWMARYTVQTAKGPKRKHIYGRTRQEVAEKLSKAVSDRVGGLVFDGDHETLEAYLRRWIDEVLRGTVKQSTLDNYTYIVRLHIIPELGRVRLRALKFRDVRRHYREKLDSGLSTRAVQIIHTVLRKALQQAVRDDVLPRNVCDAVTAPRQTTKEMQPLTPAQAKRLLENVREDRWRALYVLAITAGLREGELLGLRWDDVDLERELLQVRRQLTRTRDGLSFTAPKRGKARVVRLTDMAIAALKAHREAQNEERARAGSLWEETSLVFTSTIGTPVDVGNLTYRSFRPLLKRTNLPRIRFHDLRHACATLLLSKGTHPKIVQEMLGHANISMTMDTYSHVLPDMQEKAVSAMDDALS
jgi:integrase